MKKLFYHATNAKNANSIIGRGILKGYDGFVYLAETQEDALKFICFRGYKEIAIFEVCLDEKYTQESFDHDMNFFKCKAFTCDSDVLPEEITNAWLYKV